MKKFNLDPQRSPTHANLVHFLTALGWTSSTFISDASVSDAWLEFSPDVSQTLEYKHLFAVFLKKNQLNELMPDTFFIDDHNWPSVVTALDHSSSRKTPWILKPSMLNNGQHIYLFLSLDEVKAHFVSPNRMGGPQVLQRYIDDPLLIQGPVSGHKFSIRHLLVLSTHRESAVYPCGYLNVALRPYEKDQYNLMDAHLTNEHLDDTRITSIQRLTDEMALYQPYKQRIVSICQRLVRALKSDFVSIFNESQPRIACIGLDFMIEAGSEKLWLLEANHGPCFPTSDTHPLFNSLYRPFWQQLIQHFVLDQPSAFIVLT